MKTTSTPLATLLGLAAVVLVTLTTAHASASARTERVGALCGAVQGNEARFTSPQAYGTSKELRVVAIGSSSTAGAGASSPGLGYVSQLASELNASWPTRSEVFNKGVGGDTLQDIVRRAPTDVYALRPNVVIVQTGTNDALRNVPAPMYRQQLQRFVTELERRKVAVILVDNQYLPTQMNSREYLDILGATHQVAQEHHLPLVSRFALSISLQSRLRLGAGDLLAADGLHPNDLMHGCTARALTATLLGGEVGEVGRGAAVKSGADRS
jgi:acyl-CoA thioesterase I